MKTDSTNDEKVSLINDTRLTEYTNRTRYGSEQVFHKGTDEFDRDRWRAEGGPANSNKIKMHDKPDNIRIKAPEAHYYAELIDGKWWWVNGCNQCNGRERGQCYVECEKHNICNTCSIPWSKKKGTGWSCDNGWQCKSCADKDHKDEKNAALDAMPKPHRAWAYKDRDEIICPWCNYTYPDSWGEGDLDETDYECTRCDNNFTVSSETTTTYTSERTNYNQS